MDANYDGHTTEIEGTSSRLNSRLWHDVPHDDKRIAIDMIFVGEDYRCVGWWQPYGLRGVVHEHPDDPGQSWSETMHRACEPIFVRARSSVVRCAAMPTPDEAFRFALGILQDVSLAKYGEG